MVINGLNLIEAAPIKDMVLTKIKDQGVTYGLGEAGYDIRIKQDVHFTRYESGTTQVYIREPYESSGKIIKGNFTIASAIEEFDMPSDLVAVVHDKSTWARKGLSVFNTVIEPGWKGFLTLELVYHGQGDLHIPAGSGIAQVIFNTLISPTNYDGKYQNQPDEPVASIWESNND